MTKEARMKRQMVKILNGDIKVSNRPSEVRRQVKDLSDKIIGRCAYRAAEHWNAVAYKTDGDKNERAQIMLRCSTGILLMTQFPYAFPLLTDEERDILEDALHEAYGWTPIFKLRRMAGKGENNS